MEQCFGSNVTSVNTCSNISSFNQCNACLKRPRLHKLLEDALNYPLVVVCAGAGYGKTRAVHSFLRANEVYATWLQISERDNIATRFWESYTSVISLSWPEAGARLAEIGFPETDKAISKYIAVMRKVAALPGKHIRVFDDFHLIHNPTVLRFFERVVNMIPSNVTLLLLSRTAPDFNLIGMMMRERVFTIQENTLCFTEEEITEYFSQLELPVTRGDIRNIYDDTQGWAFAVNLIGRSLAKEQKYERYALEAMKKNVFRLIEAETSQAISEPLWHFLLRISLIDHLAASLIKTLANDDAIIKEMELVNAYIRYDLHLDTYMIHHLFLEYLRQKQDEFLTDEEKRGTYQTAGAWCDANGYHMDALSYYEKSGDYDAITHKIASFNIQIPPDMAQYAMEIFDRAPGEIKSINPIFPSMHLKLKINLGQFDEASVLAKRYASEYEARPESPERSRGLTTIYAAWAILRMFMCTYTDVYDFDVYYKRMGEHFNKSPFKTIGQYNIVPISAWASLVGTNRAGAQEEYANAISRSIPDVSNMGNGCFIGLDCLVRGELCYYCGEFNNAEQYLKQSNDKAQAHDQYITQNRALVYLMQISFFRGDIAGATMKLQAMAASLNEKDYGVRYTMYDIACGFYQLMLGQTEQIPEWLKGDFSPYSHPSFIENYANRVRARYHYQTRQYSALLAFVENVMGQQTILFGAIELKVLAAMSLYQLKQRVEAVDMLTEAYYLAESNNIIIPFIQYAKDMRTLSAAAIRDARCPIPKVWLEKINRKASAFAKRQSHMIAEYNAANNIENELSLTKRETEILRDLSQGLSRTETAASQNISANTVKMTVNIIYDKLHANNLADAIRIAMDRKII